MTRKLSKRHLAQKMKLHFLRMKSFKKLRQEIYGIREYSHCRVYVMQYGSRSAPQLVSVGPMRLEYPAP